MWIDIKIQDYENVIKYASVVPEHNNQCHEYVVNNDADVHKK